MSFKFKPEEIARFASNAGFQGDALATAVAIAQAESGGDPDAYNPETLYFSERGIPAERYNGRGSIGLWQIFRFIWIFFEGANLHDPQVNACAAFYVYRQSGESFRPWSTYRSGEYKKYLPATSVAAPAATAQPGAPA